MSLLFQERHEPPRLDTIPSPSPRDSRPLLTLSELIPGRYADTIARLDCFRVSERRDQLGAKQVYTGLIEDKTFRVPFVCHKTSLYLERNAVYRIKSAYTHEFQDSSILLILTEYSRIQPVPVDDLRDYLWLPRINGLPRPITDVILEGTVSNIYSTSGLVKRCNNVECWSSTPAQTVAWKAGAGMLGFLRVSLTARVPSEPSFHAMQPQRVLGRSLSEILFLANTATKTGCSRIRLDYLRS